MSIHTLVVTSGPRLGDIEAAVVATADEPAVRGRVGRHAVRGRRRGRRAPLPRAGPPRHRDARREAGRAGRWLESGHDCDDRASRVCPTGWSIVGGGFAGLYAAQQPRHRPRGPPDARRPAQLPPLPAAALPGRDRRPVARRHRPAAALHPAQAAQHDGHPRRGGRASIPSAARSCWPTAARSPTTRSSSRPAPTTPTSTTPSGRPIAPGLKTMEDATEIRRRILIAFEAAEREADPERAARRG